MHRSFICGGLLQMNECLGKSGVQLNCEHAEDFALVLCCLWCLLCACVVVFCRGHVWGGSRERPVLLPQRSSQRRHRWPEWVDFLHCITSHILSVLVIITVGSWRPHQCHDSHLCAFQATGSCSSRSLNRWWIFTSPPALFCRLVRNSDTSSPLNSKIRSLRLHGITEWALSLQCGADSLGCDRLGCFNLSIRGHGWDQLLWHFQLRMRVDILFSFCWNKTCSTAYSSQNVPLF